MAVARQHLTIDQGADWIEEWEWVRNGDPVDMSGWTAEGMIRMRPEDNDELLDFSSFITLDSAGHVAVHVPAEETEELNWRGPATYQIELTDGDGVVYRFIEGKVRLSLEVVK